MHRGKGRRCLYGMVAWQSALQLRGLQLPLHQHGPEQVNMLHIVLATPVSGTSLTMIPCLQGSSDRPGKNWWQMGCIQGLPRG